ncbi:PAS domain S-box protein [Methylovulum psychrotolerans]|uniref:PAS domain S-box protein n=1 Tax=Methylovulum psychrotolerans TaxID=1704499 RepID=UPI00147664F4|nr:PAS domain S-box protein [Methylovulum psychrotolerans]
MTSGVGIQPPTAAAPEKSPEELLEDLHLHQIELEMQNEALRVMHQAVVASRDRYMQLYDFAPICYLTLNQDGLITEANLTCANLLQIKRENLLKSRFDRLVTPDDHDRWHRHFLYVKQHCGRHTYELTLHRADNTPFYGQIDCLNSSDASTTLIRLALTDITERKQTEEALRIAAAAFEMQACIIVTDAQKFALRVNRAFCRVTGYRPNEVVGVSPLFLRSGVHEAGFYHNLWETVAREGYWEGEIWDKRKNGEIFPVWQTITAVTDKKGHISHYVGSFTDITAQKQAERVLLDARSRLESQVVHSKEELEQIKAEVTAVNNALEVLLKHREKDKTEAKCALVEEMESTVFPFLKQLKQENANRQQDRLIGILEHNLQEMVKSYGCPTDISSAFRQLSPVEVQVASMVRQGLPTKLIAATLKISAGTVGIHRKHIRKKLGLDNQAVNLRSYLLGLAE